MRAPTRGKRGQIYFWTEKEIYFPEPLRPSLQGKIDPSPSLEGDPKKSERVMAALMKMGKIDIATFEAGGGARLTPADSPGKRPLGGIG